MALTNKQIDNTKPGPNIIKLSDGGGLQLWVMPNGSKLWNLAYRDSAQKQRKLSFGPYPRLGLADARKKRDEAKALLASGIDPNQQKRLDKLSKAISDATTFKAIAEEYLDKMKREGRAASTLEKTEWLLAIAFPFIGERPISEIKPQEILAVLRRLGLDKRRRTDCLYSYAVAVESPSSALLMRLLSGG
ncbi:MAG: hypothetical protein CFE31_16295 [Rhizobiales bacterium PAR1]|nr:MAG: hypothetical protein CFE31_16295 [Rhizobiales bacterium PAR1]